MVTVGSLTGLLMEAVRMAAVMEATANVEEVVLALPVPVAPALMEARRRSMARSMGKQIFLVYIRYLVKLTEVR